METASVPDDGVGARVRGLRMSNAQTLRALAGTTGIPHSTIWSIEHARKSPTLAEVQRLADGLGVAWTVLVGIGPRVVCPCCGGAGWI